ncbi:MAG TPA: bifunctional nuclease domain-containing protein [Ktedonobacteraceae bacterium]|jgi:RNA polymerase sigma-70 factor (ECF subfamily)
MRPPGDGELVRLARSGHKEAFGELIERYQPMVRRLAFGVSAQEDWVQEVSQEAFLAAYLSLEQLREPERFKAWLYSIVLNVARALLKERKQNPLSLENLMGGLSGEFFPLAEAFVDPQEVVEEQELHRLLLEAVQALSPRERVATLLFYYKQLSLQEIAAVLGISLTAVKSRLFKARAHLRRQLLPGAHLAPARSRTERKRTMVKVVVHAVRKHPHTDQRIVVLKDEATQRYLLIWIAQMEALAIALGLTGITPPRPMPIHFLASVLKATGVHLEGVRIVALRNEIFYAVATVRNGEQLSDLDARPSDALGLAILMGSPIFVAPDVLEQHGVTLPEGQAARIGARDEEQRRAEVLQTLEECMQSLHTLPAAEEEEQSRQLSLALLLGEDA